MELAVLENIGYIPKNGLVICSNNPKTEHISEWYHIIDKALDLEVDAVLFRRYFDAENNHLNSKPSVYIFQREDSFFNTKAHKDLHAKIWSTGEIDTYIILGKAQLDIVNARRPAETKNQEDVVLDSLKLIPTVQKAIKQFNDQRFSAHIFGTGTFWEQEDFVLQFDEKQTPFHKMLEFLEKTRKRLQDKYSKQDELVALDRLLLLSLLIMFLEEKTDSQGRFALEELYEEYQVESFQEILTKNSNGKLCIEFLQRLSNKYNGQIFDVLEEKNENGFDERKFIKQIDLSLIASFVEGNLDPTTQQLSLWREYNFNYLPIEFISAIYESFLQSEATQKGNQKEKGVVYTPPFLVNFLVDEVMPLDLKPENYLKNHKIQYKILDPSCGSGVFLVSAYKRLLEWWAIQNYDNRKNINNKARSEAFKQILEDNIFGVDINKMATQITIFSLTLAFLDKIDPKLLWEKFQFKNLSQKNISQQSFFEWTVSAPKDFDLVIGNPPFNVPNGHKAKDYYKTFVDTFREKMEFDYTSQVPDNFAFYFLEFAKQLSPQKQVCLIIPTTLLLHSPQGTSIKYRTALLEKSNVEKIYDFTHLSSILFKNVSVASCVIILKNTEPEFRSIQHTIIKRLISVEKRVKFEISHYDQHTVKFEWACRYPFIWKCNLLGGGRLFHLIYRLSLLQDLNGFIKEKKKENSEWIFEVGYEIGNKNNGHFIEYIHEKNRVSGISDGKIIYDEIEKEEYFYRPTLNSFKDKEKLFMLPMIVIHKKIGSNYLPVGIKESHSEDYLVFKSNYLGIHSPKDDFETLRKIYERLQNHKDTYMLWIFINSSSTMIGRGTDIKKKELETLPFPDFTEEEEEYLELSDTEKILRDDVLNHYKHLGKSVKVGDDGYETLERKLNINKPKDKEVLENFGKAFCDNLNDIYAKDGKSWQVGKIYQTQDEDENAPISKGFIIYQLGFGLTTETKKIPFDEKVIKDLIFDKWANQGAIWVRDMRLYQHIDAYDSVFLIKPSNIRYWLRSIALKDAGKTFLDLKQAGL